MNEVVINAANVCQTLAGIICTLAYLPQLWRIIKYRSTEDLSMSSWILWAVSGSFCAFYAVVQYIQYRRGLPLVFSASTNICLILIILVLMLYFRLSSKPKLKKISSNQSNDFPISANPCVGGPRPRLLDKA